MKPYQRYLLALGILLVDWVIFIIPLASIFIACILISRPAWFKDWVQKLYAES